MSDAPPAEVTPAVAPETMPVPATPAEPATPATPAEPAAEPAAQPAGEYPVEPEGGGSQERPYTTTYNGERVDMTEAEFHRLAHMGFEHLAAQRQTQGQQPQAQTPEGDPDDVGQLRQEIAGLRQELNASTYETRVQGETRRINETVDSEMPKHKVLQDNPALQSMARRNILATLSHNPRLSEEQATKQVASELGSALNAQRETWMKGKISDAGSAEAAPGAPGSSTPGPKKLTGKDLMMGKVRDQALRRLGAKDLISS